MCPNINHPDYKQLVEDLKPEYGEDAPEYAHLAWIRHGETKSIPTGEQAKDLLAPKLNSGKQSSKPSPELGEALKSLVSDNGKTAKDALQTISEHDGQYQDLARELLKHEPNGLDAKLFLKDNTQKESTYNPNDHSINISRSFTDDPYHYMHEAIHAITSREIQSQLGDAVGKDYKDAKTVDDVLKIVRNKNVSEPVKDLVHLFLKSKEALAGEKHYGFKNLEEFVAEAFTNSDFQERLNTVKGIGGKTLWQHFVEAIRSILGFPPKVGSALSETIRAALDLSKQDHSESYNRNFEARDLYGGEESSQPKIKRDSLEAAKSMAAAGKTPEEIRSLTGWFPGKYDGKLRYEIPDSDAKFKTDFKDIPESKLFEKSEPLKLGDVLDHPQLFNTYPDAKNIEVSKRRGFFDFFGSLQGSFDGKNNINITPYAKEPLSTLLHEVQHWIQEKEGFAKGGNEQSVIDNLSSKQKEELAKSSLDKLQSNLDSQSETINLLKKFGNSELAKQTRQAWEKFHDIATNDKDNAAARQDAYRAATDLDQRIYKELFGKDSYFKLTTPERDAAIAISKQDFEKRLKGSEEAFVKIQQLIGSLKSGDPEALKEAIKSSGQSFQLYQRIAGEVEARDIQSRKDLTSEQRKSTEPYSSENVHPDDAITMTNSNNTESRQNPQSEKFSEDEFTRHLGEEDFKTTQDWFNKLPSDDKQYLNSQYNGDALKFAQDHFQQNGEEVTGTNKSINAEETPLSGNANDEVKARKIQIQNVKDLLNKNIEQPLVVTETPIQKQFKDLGYQFLNDQDLTTYTNLLDNFVNSRSRTSDPVTERIPTENLQAELAQLQQKANQGKYDYFANKNPEAFAGKTFNDFGNDIDIVSDYNKSYEESDSFETQTAKTPHARLDTEDAIRDIQQSMIDNNRLDELRTTLLKDNIDLHSVLQGIIKDTAGVKELMERDPVIKESVGKWAELLKEVGVDNDKIISQIYDYAVNTDPSELQSYSDVRKLQYLAQALNTDGYFPFINTFVSSEMRDILKTRGLNYVDGYSKRNPLTANIESVIAQRDRLSGGSKRESDFITNLGVPIHDAYTRAQRAHTDFLLPITDAINKHYTKELGRPFTDIENNRMGILATLRQRYLDESPQEALRRNLGWLEDSAKNIENSNVKAERQAAIDQRSFITELTKGIDKESDEDQRPLLEDNFKKLVSEEALGNIKDNQHIFELTNPLAKMASEFGYGKEYHEIENYFPSFTLPTGGSFDDTKGVLYQSQLDLMTPSENFMIGSKGTADINSSRNGMSSIKLRQRVVPEGRRLVLNLNNMIINRGRLNLLDGMTALRRREMANVMKSRDLSFFLGDYHKNGDQIYFDQRGRTNLLRRSYNQEWAAMIQSNSYLGTFQQAFNGLTRRFSVAQLASLYRAPVHILGNLTSYFVNHPERVFDLMKSFGAMLEGYRNPDYKNFLDKLFFESRKRSWDVTQDRSTNIHIGLEGDSPLQQMWQGIKSSKVFQGIGKVDSTLQKVLFAPLKWSDTSSANAIMLTEYLHNERDRLNNPNLQFKDLVLNDKSGISYHKALNETEKNVTIGDASRRGLWLNNSNPSISLLRNLTMAFAGKKIMNATNFTVAIHNLMNGSMNSADKAATVKFMGGIVAQTAMFELVKWGLQGFTGNAILQNQKQNTDDSLESLYRKQMSQGSLTPRQKILLEQEISSRRHLRSAFQNADSNNWNSSKLLSVGAIASNMLPNMFVASSLLNSQEDGVIHLLYDTYEQNSFSIAKQGELLRLNQVKEQARAVGNGSLYGQASQKISDLQSQKYMNVINRQDQNFQDWGGIIGEFINQNGKFGQTAVNSVYKSQEIYPSDITNILSAYGIGQPDVQKFLTLQKQIQAPEDQAQAKLDQKIAKLQTQGRNY